MGANERVLIVEDELHALAGLAELVSGWGYRTETARDGIEGLEKVLHKSAKFPAPGRARVKFGPALRLEGSDYAALAKRIESAVRAIS